MTEFTSSVTAKNSFSAGQRAGDGSLPPCLPRALHPLFERLTVHIVALKMIKNGKLLKFLAGIMVLVLRDHLEL